MNVLRTYPACLSITNKLSSSSSDSELSRNKFSSSDSDSGLSSNVIETTFSFREPIFKQYEIL